MRITFVLPSYEPRPSGGFKIVYEYANRLAAKGHRVALLHPWTSPGSTSSLGARVRRARFYPRARRGVSWFELAPGVHHLLVPRLDPDELPDGDALIATAWRTAAPVASADPAKGVGFYLIQSYETWDGPKEEVDATWHLPLQKIVVARWLEKLGAAFGETERTTHVPNAIDFDEFFPTTPQAERGRRVGMLWHHWAIKGGPDGLAALTRARERVPTLEAMLFGTPRAPEALPPWATYVRCPTGEKLRRLYDSFAIFLHPSRLEGWGLPAAEAMACGCALVAAANDGVLEFAIDGRTAALAPVGDAEGLADRIVTLVENPGRREQLAHSGWKAIQAFTWDRSVKRFEQVLLDHTP